MDRHALCEFLLATKLVTRNRLDEVLAEQRTIAPTSRFLVRLVERGDVDEVALTQALSRQLSIPWVRLEQEEVPAAALVLVPREIAERFSLVPVYVRRETVGPSTLFVALDDPTWEEALLTTSVVAGMPVRPLLATRSQVVAAIERYYTVAHSSNRPTRPAAPIVDNDYLIEYSFTRPNHAVVR